MEGENKVIINKIKNRILHLSPTVKEGLERECTKDDFFSEGDKPIGKGGFGQVWKVRHKVTDKIYVIKVISKQNIIEQKMAEQINREVEIMYRVNHPHIIKLYNHFEDDDNLYLIMHYASKGQLYSLLKKQNRFDQRTTAQFMREIISAVGYLHSFTPSIIHRDIKPENILLDENGRVKLADFGWSNYGNKKRITYCGTPEYLAPEMIKKEGHDTTVDIWDLGILMFELLTGRPPFSGSNQSELFLNIKKHKIMWPDDFPPLAKNLISKILKQNPKERITLDEILSHAWFEKNPPTRPVLHSSNANKSIEANLINKIEDNQGSHQSSIKNHNLPLTNISSPAQKVKKKRESVVEMIRKASNNKINFTGNETVIGTPLDHIQKYLPQGEEIIEKLKKENNEIKLRADKAEFENKTLKSEVMKLKEFCNKYQNDIEIQKLKDELDKYKVMNKERLALLAEIEEKNYEILELKNKFLNIENELDTTKRNFKQTQIKYQEAITNLEANELKINDFKSHLENTVKEKEEAATQYQKKLEILQVRLLDSDKQDEETQVSHTNRLLEMTFEAIKEIESTFKIKTDNLAKNLQDINEDCLKCENKMLDFIMDKHNAILEIYYKIKSTIEDDLNKIKSKFNKESSSVIYERVEWQKKQINELMPFKIKSSNLEMQVTKLEAQMKKIEEVAELHKINIQALEKLNKEKDFSLVKKEKYITNLEAKLCDVKDYIFRNHTDKLEEFKKWYKF